ncbi:hypothetical protein IEQ34_011609 [Dendrobium chrysotoxum]|uniref:Disease resistance N-terminal domain-containing protein n=1 Tax=Dendrobium chrysotoxum TaxID=161865 RepID=A0AAV7GU52_DENCH|nr:hypothetical protein IEQ34_011609 [Dendrobium chrysotoxum]
MTEASASQRSKLASQCFKTDWKGGIPWCCLLVFLFCFEWENGIKEKRSNERARQKRDLSLFLQIIIVDFLVWCSSVGLSRFRLQINQMKGDHESDDEEPLSVETCRRHQGRMHGKISNIGGIPAMMGDFARYKAFAPPCSRGETIGALFLLPVLGSSSWHSQAPGPLALVLLPDLSRSPRRPFRFGTPAPGSQTEAEALLADVPALVNVGIPLCYRVPWKWRDVRWQTVLQKELERLRENHPKIQAVVFASNQAQISNQSPAFNEWIWQLRDAIDEADDVLDELEWQTVLQKELKRLRENHPKIQAVVFASNQAQISNQSPAFNEWIWQLRDAIDEADDVPDELEYMKHKEQLSPSDFLYPLEQRHPTPTYHF